MKTIRSLALLATLLPALALAAPPVTPCDAAGTCITMGQTTAAGSVAVVQASDTTAKIEGKDAHAAATTTTPVRVGAVAETDGAQMNSTGVADDEATNLKADVEGRMLVRTDHPNRVACVLTTTSTTSAIITGCSAPGANLSIYITDISVYGGVANGATAATTIQSGTGGTCGTATTIAYYCQHAATAGCEAHFATPRKLTANHEVCILDAAVGTKFAVVHGYIAP